MKSLNLHPIILFLVFFLIFNSCSTEHENNDIVQQLKGSTLIDSQFVFKTNELKRYKFPTHINDLIVDRSKASFSEVFMVVVEPGNAPLFHKHDDTEQIFYMVSGNGTLTITDERKTFRVKPGDVIRIPISTYHTIKADEDNTVTYLCVDCFGGKNNDEPTWDDHVKVVCKANSWDYSKVIEGEYK